MHAQEVTQEVKMSYFCGLPARTFETQEVESLNAEAARSYENYRKPQGRARSFSSSR